MQTTAATPGSILVSTELSGPSPPPSRVLNRLSVGLGHGLTPSWGPPRLFFLTLQDSSCPRRRGLGQMVGYGLTGAVALRTSDPQLQMCPCFPLRRPPQGSTVTSWGVELSGLLEADSPSGASKEISEVGQSPPRTPGRWVLALRRHRERWGPYCPRPAPGSLPPGDTHSREGRPHGQPTPPSWLWPSDKDMS